MSHFKFYSARLCRDTVKKPISCPKDNDEAPCEICKNKDKDKVLCQKLCKGVSEILDTPIRGADKGWKSQSSGQHSRLAFCEAGGIIMESFFISNDTELQKYFAKREALFDRIAKDIIEFLG